MSDLTSERPVRYVQPGVEYEEMPADNADLLEGMMTGVQSGGYLRKFTLGDNFHGHLIRSCLNASGADGDINGRVLKGPYRARVALPNVAITDQYRQSAVFASDSGGLSLRVGYFVGRVVRYVSSGIAVVEFYTNPIIGVLSETITLAAMTDNTNTTGYKDFVNSLPAGCQVLGCLFDIKTAFVGDTSAVIQVGVAGNLDNFTALTTVSVFTTGVRGVQAPGATDNTFMGSATAPRVTITGAADFTSISAGEVDVKIRFLMPLQ